MDALSEKSWEKMATLLPETLVLLFSEGNFLENSHFVFIEQLI